MTAYYGPERAREKLDAAEWLLACAIPVLVVLGTIAVMSLA